MPPLNIGTLRAVARRLDETDLVYAFTGGAIVNLLLDNPELSPVRPTDDVDVIVELVSNNRYSDIETQLRASGFKHDMSEGAPICRWLLENVVVDIMPTEGQHIGLNTQWFREALRDSVLIEYAHTKLKVVSPIGFLATKYLTFTERGDEDFYASHDLEDFITVIDGRKDIAAEIKAAPSVLKCYLITAIQVLLNNNDFVEALSGHLPGDSASQQRLPLLKDKLNSIAKMS